MSRLVEPVSRSGAQAAGAGGEDAKTRIAKYIPGELLAFYAMWTQAVASMPWAEWRLELCVAGALLGVVATYVYFDRFFPEATREARAAHRLISPFAFAVHAYTITGAVVAEVFVPGVALAATALVTLASAIYVPSASS